MSRHFHHRSIARRLHPPRRCRENRLGKIVRGVCVLYMLRVTIHTVLFYREYGKK
eukprot:TRINITY_DN171_c0_g1_i1.p2 TRINITY_DN171_c0_g1~~TRINITY_DN171_c0_g1_i1.p2  ORF type:complete len:55 (-),score=4.95 TRINITY_DN171_c0_g1_i1:55-219(-)